MRGSEEKVEGEAGERESEMERGRRRENVLCTCIYSGRKGNVEVRERERNKRNGILFIRCLCKALERRSFNYSFTESHYWIRHLDL